MILILLQIIFDCFVVLEFGLIIKLLNLIKKLDATRRVMWIDYDNPKIRKEPVKVSDPSQPWKIGIVLVFGGWFVVWSILMLKK